MHQRLPSWICCQLGAREHYAIPRALRKSDQLIALMTDAWVSPGSLLSNLPNSRLKERFHRDLDGSTVYHNTVHLLGFELEQKLRNSSRWDLIIARNKWFQKQVSKQLNQLSLTFSDLNHSPIVFAYSYAALDIFRYAKEKGWLTVLGQIDPGPIEESIVAHLHREAGISRGKWQPAPATYWKDWYEEIALADRIIVNSEWSKQCLVKAGVSSQSTQIIPLAYQPSEESVLFNRKYPEKFTQDRPLRVLFLGQVNLRKGILPLLEAFEHIISQPIELWIVGPTQVEIQAKWFSHPKIRWTGSIPRSAVADYYRQADLFILPSYSDGFALTQLEAIAWKLPLVVSKYCGHVIKHGVTGFVLDEVETITIAKTLEVCLKYPKTLQSMSERLDVSDFSLSGISKHFLNSTP